MNTPSKKISLAKSQVEIDELLIAIVQCSESDIGFWDGADIVAHRLPISQVVSKAKSAAKKVKTGVSGFINRCKSWLSQGAHLLSFFS
jgi:hypothetical protein